MIAVDTNVIVDLIVSSQPSHAPARQWVGSVGEPLVTTHTNVAECLRLLTHPRVFRRPMLLAEAVELVGSFLEAFDVEVLEEAEEWWVALGELAGRLRGIRGNEVFDARIALCLRYNGVKLIATHDTDFAKYPFLKIVEVPGEPGRG